MALSIRSGARRIRTPKNTIQSCCRFVSHLLNFQNDRASASNGSWEVKKEFMLSVFVFIIVAWYAPLIVKFYISIPRWLQLRQDVMQMIYVILSYSYVIRNLVWLVVLWRSLFFLEGLIIFACHFAPWRFVKHVHVSLTSTYDPEFWLSKQATAEWSSI